MNFNYLTPKCRARDLKLEESLCKSQLHQWDESDFYIEDDGTSGNTNP